MQRAKKILKEIKNSFRDAAALTRGNFLVVTIGMSLVSAFGGFFWGYESLYIRDLGGSDFVIGAYFAVTGLVWAMAGTPGGYICDIYGRRKIIVVGNYVTALMWFIIAMAPNWQFYFAAGVFLSIAAFWTVAEEVILMDSMPVGKRGLGYSLLGTIIRLTGLASPYIGGWIFYMYRIPGMRLVLLSVAAADLTKAVLYTRLLKETLEIKEERKSAPSLKRVLRWTGRSFVETIRTLKWLPRSLLGFCILNILYAFAWLLVSNFFLLYAIDVIRLTTVEWGLISMIQLTISLLLSFPGGRLVDRYGKRWAILASCVVEVPFFLGFIHSRSYLSALAVFVPSTAVWALTEPAWGALQVDLTPREKRGKVTSLLRIMGGFSGFFGSLMGGYLYTLSPAIPFWIYVFIAALAALFAFMIIHEPKRPEV